MSAGTARSGVLLNPSQQAAVERWGQDVCVVAGPGSGKTRVLIERFRWLVESRGVAPGRILAVTFTEKAATEIKRRLIDAFRDSDQLRQEIERAWVSTIHGFCTRLLKENAIAAGVDPDFGLLDEARASLLGQQCADAVLDELLQRHPAAMREILLELDTAGQDLSTALLSLYEEARSAGVAVEELACPAPPDADPWPAIVDAARIALSEPPPLGTVNQREAYRQLQTWCQRIVASRSATLETLDGCPPSQKLKTGTRARSLVEQLEKALLPAAKGAILLRRHAALYPLLLEALRAIHVRYQQAKVAQGVLDFEDLQEGAIRLLESNAALRERVRESFDQVLLDELQDTNRLQWLIINLVCRPGTLFAVGDVNQSIYFFRHADPSVFRDYRQKLVDAGHIIDELRDNYRSRPEVIALVNAVVPYLLDGVEPHRIVPRREFAPAPEPAVEFIHTFAATPDDDPRATEARWIAQRIASFEGQRKYADIAILARTIGALEPIQQALDAAGIPSVTSGGRSFYETREIRDLVAWLRVLANPNDEISLLAVLRSPLGGLDDETLLRLSAVEGRLYDALRLPMEEVPKRMEWIAGFLEQQRRQAPQTSPDRLLSAALDATSYEEGLTPRARGNISKFLDFLRQRHRRDPLPLNLLTSDLARLRDTGSEAEAAPAETGDAVRLMSVHAAKGLEFPIVFVAALRAGVQNRDPVFCLDGKRQLGARWRHPVEGPGVPDPVHLAVCARKQRLQEGEEDRLLYVAMTRAEEQLIFTASPGGNGTWSKRVAEPLGLPASAPKQELHDTVTLLDGARIKVEFLNQVPQSNTAAQAPRMLYESAAIIDPPAALDHRESMVPVTSVAQFGFCPRQYYLARYLRVPAEPAPRTTEIEDAEPPDIGEMTASEIGVAAHAVLAGKPAPDAPPEAFRLAEVFRESPLGQRAAQAGVAAHEYDFLFELEGMILRGQMDLWFEDRGELILVDYKTDRVAPGDERRHAYRYGPQLRLYALALSKLRRRTVTKALLFYLRTGTAVEVRLGEPYLDESRELVRNFAAAQAAIAFPLREGSHCLRCAYYQNLCPAKVVENLTELEPPPTS